MEKITTLTFFRLNKNRFWAFKQMALSHKFLMNCPGLDFYKIMGTGSGKGFSLWPDFSTYALLAVWDKNSSSEVFFRENVWLKKYMQKSNSCRTFYLKPFHSKGNWGGINPFISSIDREFNSNFSKIVVITRASIRWYKLLSFWKSVPYASKAIKDAIGVEFYKGIGEWPFIQQATFSIWKSEESIFDFAYASGKHSEIIKKTKKNKWYKEDMFTRFKIISDTDFKSTILEYK